MAKIKLCTKAGFYHWAQEMSAEAQGTLKIYLQLPEFIRYKQTRIWS